MTDTALTPNGAVPAPLKDLPLTIYVRVGTARRTIADVLEMREGELITLSSRIDEPVEICIDDRVIARGELVELEEGGGLAVKLTELCGPASR
jgi:flagellar motor switch protein FliN/FliY